MYAYKLDYKYKNEYEKQKHAQIPKIDGCTEGIFSKHDIHEIPVFKRQNADHTEKQNAYQFFIFAFYGFISPENKVTESAQT